MRFHLALLALTSFFLPTLSSSSDVLYIKKLIADFAIALDTKNFNAFDTEFIPTATYFTGNETLKGVPPIKKFLAATVDNNVTQTALTTQSISLTPPFDNQGGAATASAITYLTESYLGQKADAGQVFVVNGLFKDKLVKTGDFSNYGGWKFSARVLQVLWALRLKNTTIDINIDGKFDLAASSTQGLESSEEPCGVVSIKDNPSAVLHLASYPS